MVAVFREAKAPFYRAWSRGCLTQVIDLTSFMSAEFFLAPESKKNGGRHFRARTFSTRPPETVTTWGRSEVGDKIAFVDTSDMIRSLLRQVAGSPLIAFEDDRCTCNLRAVRSRVARRWRRLPPLSACSLRGPPVEGSCHNTPI
jgi:hypothetical protein